MSAFIEFVDEVRMKRIHAYLLFTYLIACFSWLIVCEVWRAGRSEWKHKRMHL